MRTFVFISNIPDFLLQPLYKSEGKDVGGSTGNDASSKRSLAPSKFDLRYERLRRLLVEHSSGVMLVMHLETKGYALALYASEGEALAACKADITPEQPGQRFRPLRLRILEKEKPRPPEPVYNPFLTVEGEEVRKVDLADTRGLELVYRGRALARWCPRTLAGEDCYFGVSCLKLHRAAVQRTVRKRPRISDEDAEAHLSPAQQQTVKDLLECVKDARAALAPATLAMPNCLFIPLSQAEAEALCEAAAKATTTTSGMECDTNNASSSGPTQAAVYQAVLQRVETAMVAAAASSATASSCLSYFPRLSCPGGAPWEWAVESAEGRCLLRRDCPLPANGAPTPLERDLYIQQLWYHMNQRNRCTTALEVLRMLQGSRRVREAVRRRAGAAAAAAAPSPASAGLHGEESAEQPPASAHDNAHSNTSTTPDKPLFICLEPWLYLPTVGCEVTVFLERGGRRVRGVVQRYGQLRLMTSAALLATATTSTTESINGIHNTSCVSVEKGVKTPSGEETRFPDVDALLARYAVLESNNDAVAEEALSHELRTFQRCFAAAVGELSQHLQRHPTTTGGEGAAWCVHLAVRLPTPVLSASSSASPSVGASAPSSATPPAVLLSCTAYQRALEECSLYAALAPPASAEAAAGEEEADAWRPRKVDVTWNTQRHPYIPLFSREVLEKLRADATD